MSLKSVGLFGGSFNPVHLGHLAIAEEVRTKYNLDKIVFVPAYIPPHKEADELASAQDRSIMLHLATVSNPCFGVSGIEIDRGGRSFSIDTIRYFHEKFDGKTEIYFIIGADMLAGIAEWKNINEILKLCRFIAVSRPGFDIKRIFNQHFLASGNFELASSLAENIILEESPMLDFSASDIRKRVREWKSIKYLVPEPVEQYIHNQKLFL